MMPNGICNILTCRYTRETHTSQILPCSSGIYLHEHCIYFSSIVAKQVIAGMNVVMDGEFGKNFNPSLRLFNDVAQGFVNLNNATGDGNDR